MYLGKLKNDLLGLVATFLGFGPAELVEASRVRFRRGVAPLVVFRRVLDMTFFEFYYGKVLPGSFFFIY